MALPTLAAPISHTFRAEPVLPSRQRDRLPPHQHSHAHQRAQEQRHRVSLGSVKVAAPPEAFFVLFCFLAHF